MNPLETKKTIVLLERHKDSFEFLCSKSLVIQSVLVDSAPKAYYMDHKPLHPDLRCFGQQFIVDEVPSGTIEILTNLGTYRFIP